MLVDWALICDHGFLDQAGKPCLIGVFENIFAQAVPATHAHATVVIQFRGESGEKATLKIEINRPNGNALTKLEGPVQISEQGGAGVQLKLQNLSLPDYGKYSLNVILDDKTARTLVFSVMKPPHAPRPH